MDELITYFTGVLVAGLLFFLITYILTGLALSSAAKRQGEKSFLAWIPVCNMYLLFKLTDTPTILILGIFRTLISGTIGTLIGFAFNILVAIKLAKLAKQYNVSPVLCYVGIIIPLVTWYPLYMIYKNAR